MSFLAMLFGFSLIILVHEWGHFIAARMCGIPVSSFSLGFGPRLLQFKWGATRYRLSLFPIGGYVHIPQSEIGPEGKRSRYAQAVVYAGGIVMNIVFAWIILAMALMIGGTLHVEPGVYVGRIAPNSPAARAGLQVGDRILEIRPDHLPGFRPTRPEEVKKEIQKEAGRALDVVLERAQERIVVHLVPQFDAKSLEFRIGAFIAGESQQIESKSFAESAAEATRASLQMFVAIPVQIPKTLFHILTTADGSAGAGPIGIGAMLWNSAKEGFGSWLFLLAEFSFSIAAFNLLPIPPLDGWHLLRTALEGLFRGPLPGRVQAIAERAGIALVLLIAAIVTVSDIHRLFQ